MKTIYPFAFYGCSALESVGSLRGMRTIGNSAFEGCVLLAGVLDCPELETIGATAFCRTALTEVRSLGAVTAIPGGNSTYTYSGTFGDCAALRKVTLPETLGSVGEVSFRRCSALEEINLGKVTYIGTQAFHGCSALMTADLGSATTVKSAAFSGCTSLESVSMPKVTSVEHSAFKDTALAEVTVPEGVTALPGGNNQGVFSVSSASHANAGTLKRVSLPEGLREIGMHTFRYRSALEEINLPGSLAVIGQSAFAGCSAMGGDVSLPGLVTLGYGAFSGTAIRRVLDLGSIQTLEAYSLNSSALEELVIPATVTSVAGNATYSSRKAEVTLKAATPPSLDNTNGLQCARRLLVPAEAIAGYMKATNWNAYANRIFAMEHGNDPSVVVDGVQLRRNGNSNVSAEGVGFSVTMCVAVPDPYAPLRVVTGFAAADAGGTGYGVMWFEDSGFNITAYRNSAAGETAVQLTTSEAASTAWMRLTVKTSEIAGCYVMEEASGTYLWKGSDVKTHLGGDGDD